MSGEIGIFIDRWKNSGANERANYQLFLSELCDLLGVDHPDPASSETEDNAYVFERAVRFSQMEGGTRPGRIDLYKRDCFVLEAKQGSEAGATKPGHGRRGTPAWEQAMLRARNQADGYIRALPTDEGRPPFLLVVDVGHVIELYSEFSQTGGTYIPFPSPGNHRIRLADLALDEVRERLAAIWTDPHALDPSKVSARVTREIADRLAKLAVSLESQGHSPEDVAHFLMRALFTMFAEDVGLLGGPHYQPFTKLLEDTVNQPDDFLHLVEELWQKMDRGGYSTSIRLNVLQFNGGLFAESSVLPLNQKQIGLLLEAAQCDWRDVEPAIFGTLLERALDPRERHKLGAHYTPRSYVERLVMPTVIDPVRDEWESVQTAAVKLDTDGETKKAIKELKDFHRRLCHIRILDPACGSGNFLYVSLEHLKRIEGEVLDMLTGLGEKQTVLDMHGETVDPHQLLGLEVNPRAAAIAELVLWIGTLQWHYRTRGRTHPPQPIIRNFKNIECRDALLIWDDIEEKTEDGTPITQWDGHTFKPHPVTGKDVPDESARKQVYRYLNPQKADWPEADYIIGNPPFIGASRMRDALGDGYTEAVRNTHHDIGESSDFVMYWWNHAADLVRGGGILRFGFITTNSVRQKFNRRVLETHLNAKNPLSLLFAIPDHPWVDDGAAVRIAMTAAEAGEHHGLLQEVIKETDRAVDGYEIDVRSTRGKISSDLTVGADVASTQPLFANANLSCRGVQLIGSGFICLKDEAAQLGLGTLPGIENYIREYRNGKDLTSRPRGVMVIDLFGLKEQEVREKYPAVYQWVAERVKPERDAKAGRTKDADKYAEEWWLFGKTRAALRKALCPLPRYIATVETSKHRFFQFLDASILPDNMLVSIAVSDGFSFGVLSSKFHVFWALATGSILGPTPRYNKTRCFETFPFPDATEEQKEKIRKLAEELDAHRKRQQALHSDLTMTGIYNVLEKLKAGETLTAKEKTIHQQGLVSVLKQIHDDLDAAVAAAYGWPADLAEEEILQRMVDLNHQRTAEEAQGKIRWLRPEYQNPDGEEQTQLDVPAAKAKKSAAAKTKKQPWPKTLPEQVSRIRSHLEETGTPQTAPQIAQTFARTKPEKILPILQTLVAVGQAKQTGKGAFTAL